MGRNKNDRLTLKRVTSFEVKGVDGDWKEVTNRWHETSRQCQGVANLFWAAWTAWHYRHDSHAKLKAWLDARQRLGNKAAGKCPVDNMPKELAKEIYHAATGRYPDLTANLVSLVIQRVQKTMASRKASSGSLPGASAILLHHESHPSYTRPFPILFDRANTKTEFEPPSDPRGNWHLRMRTWREQIDGKSHRLEDRIELWCKGQKVQSQVRILERIASGEYTFAGSQLVYSKGKRKWFAKLCYSMPQAEKPKLNKRKTAVLRAAANDGQLWAWELVMPDGSVRHPLGHCPFVPRVRRQLLTDRWSRQANYRNAGSANKGHGRERAVGRNLAKMQQSWKDFGKRLNHGATREVVNVLVVAGIGRLVYEQPDGEFRDTRFLTTAGKVEGRTDSTGWDWFQVKTFLEQKCEAVGIEFSTVKAGETSGDDETPGTDRSDATYDRNGSSVNGQKNGRANGRHKSNGKPDRSKRAAKSAAR